MPPALIAHPACRRPRKDGELDGAAREFDRLRPRLLGIAYRILGRWTEAEDTVQDAWLRWQTCDRTVVVNSTAFLVTTTTRLALNTAQSARARRESYVGRFATEPVDTRNDPAGGIERREALERGIELLLGRLSPAERAAYVLRQAFDYPYWQIARVLHTTGSNARQLVSRASKRLAGEPRHPLAGADHTRLVHAFVSAARHGDMAAIERVFSAETGCLATA